MIPRTRFEIHFAGQLAGVGALADHVDRRRGLATALEQPGRAANDRDPVAYAGPGFLEPDIARPEWQGVELEGGDVEAGRRQKDAAGIHALQREHSKTTLLNHST